MRASDLPAAWRDALASEFDRPYMQALAAFLAAEHTAGTTVYPSDADRFRALALTAPADVRVVILGQDPYHGPDQAHGLSFSVRPGVRVPPSLRNIYKELTADLGIAAPRHGSLERWAGQGVLLLNAVLSVRAGAAGSHQKRGWEAFTDAIVRTVAASADPTVFLLWGAHAQRKAASVADAARGGRHLVLESAHPSPLSAHAGFLGSRPFSKANAFLVAHGRAAVDWTLPPLE